MVVNYCNITYPIVAGPWLIQCILFFGLFFFFNWTVLFSQWELYQFIFCADAKVKWFYISNFIPVIFDKSFIYLVFQQVIHICKYKMVHTEKSPSLPACSSVYPSPLTMEITVRDSYVSFLMYSYVSFLLYSYVSFRFLYSQRNIDPDPDFLSVYAKGGKLPTWFCTWFFI